MILDLVTIGVYFSSNIIKVKPSIRDFLRPPCLSCRLYLEQTKYYNPVLAEKRYVN